MINGDVVIGEDTVGEYFYYEMGVKLNEVGAQMFEWVKGSRANRINRSHAR